MQVFSNYLSSLISYTNIYMYGFSCRIKTYIHFLFLIFQLHYFPEWRRRLGCQILCICISSKINYVFDVLNFLDYYAWIVMGIWHNWYSRAVLFAYRLSENADFAFSIFDVLRSQQILTSAINSTLKGFILGKYIRSTK